MQKRILSLLVDNTAGVLSRIAGLFSRRGYNIDSLTVGVTADERYSRMTVVCSGDSMILEQITKQLAKLVDVRDIKVLEPDNSVSRELVLVKVAARPEQREGIISIANILFIYLEFGRRSTNRQTYVNRLEFNEDGTIRPVDLTLEGVGALRKIKQEKKLKTDTVYASSISAPLNIEPMKDPSCRRTEYFIPGFCNRRCQWLPLDGC